MFQKIKEALQLELPNLILWSGAFFALGIGIYFVLPFEPNVWASVIGTFMVGVLFFFGRKEYVSRLVLSYLFFLCLGFCVVTVKAHLVTAPVLNEPLFETTVSGVVVKTEPLHNGQRLTLEGVVIQGIAPYKTPERIRLNYRLKTPIIRVGDEVSGYAHLFPPMQPVEIGAYNFARDAWFKRLGSTGALKRLIDHKKNEKKLAITDRLERFRQTIMMRIINVLPPQSAAVAIPLIIGEQGTVSSEIYDLYRQAGIVHVLSVSGFHLTLLAGLVFFLIRGFLALFPTLDGRVNTKKVAAFLSLLVVLFYLLISGMQVPAIRSFLMIAVVLVAVLLDRHALSLRSVVIAGVFILFFWPETLIGVSFQLSFMAVFALVSLYEFLMRHLMYSHLRRFTVYKIWLLILGTVLVSALASIATAPYAIYHFNQYPLYSILGNLMTSVLFSFVIMPLLLVSVLLMPFGWDAPFLKMSGYFFDLIEKMCQWIITLPNADLTIPSFDTWGLLVMTFGFLVLFLCVTKIRWMGIAIVVFGALSFYTLSKPDILVSEGGRVIAVRQENGDLKVSNVTDNTLVTNTWLRRNGQNPKKYPSDYLFKEQAVWIKGKKIAFHSLNCINADLSFVLQWGMGDCLEPVIYRTDLWDSKTHQVYIRNNEIIVQTIQESVGKRFWSEVFFVESYDKKNYTDEDGRYQ